MHWRKLVVLMTHLSIYHLLIYIITHPPNHPTIPLPTYLSIYSPAHPLDIHCQLTCVCIHMPSSIYSFSNPPIHAHTHLSTSPFTHLSTC